MATVESLDYNLSFNFDKKTFDKFNKSLSKSIAGFAKLGAALAAAQTAAFFQAKGVADQVDGMAKLSRRIGTTTSEYQKLVFAANDFGASASDVESSLKSLTKAQEDVLLGKGDLEAFGRLGINPSDFNNSADLLLAISDSISNIQSDSEKINLLQRVGVSENLLQTLEGGSSAVRALGDEFEGLGATITKDQKKAAGEFQAVWLRTTTIISGASRKVGTDSLKTINKFLEKFVKFATNNMKQIIAGFERFFSVMNSVTGVLFGVLERIFLIVSRIISLFGGFEEAVIRLGVAFVLLKRRMLLAFALPLLIAGLLLVVIDDIVAGLSGKESFFGDLLSKIDPLFTKLKSIRDFILEIVANIGKVANIIPGVNVARLKFGGGQVDTTTESVDVSNIQAPPRAGANITVNVHGADGRDVVEQINTQFQRLSNSINGE